MVDYPFLKKKLSNKGLKKKKSSSSKKKSKSSKKKKKTQKGGTGSDIWLKIKIYREILEKNKTNYSSETRKEIKYMIHDLAVGEKGSIDAAINDTKSKKLSKRGMDKLMKNIENLLGKKEMEKSSSSDYIVRTKKKK